jgi:hypothetical protein
MAIFNKKPIRILVEQDVENTRVLDIYKNKKGTFKLYCDVKKASGTIGVNTNYSLSFLGATGWVIIADNNDLGIPKIDLLENAKVTIQLIDEGFAKFIELADKV